MQNKHTTPFNMCKVKYHIKPPIFIARKWIHHRTSNINEYSKRYSILEKKIYLPALTKLASQNIINKQGRDKTLTKEQSNKILKIFKKNAEQCYKNYTYMLDKNNINFLKELARINLNLNFYTELYWKIDLNNLFNFIKLRNSKNAQYKIKVYANTILNTIKEWYPIATQAFEKYLLFEKQLSQQNINFVI